MELKKYRLSDIAKVEISGIDKKSKEGQQDVLLCNFVDVYYNWAVTKDLESKFMPATASDSEIESFKLHKGQVAITKDSETRDDIGVATYIADDFDNLVVLGYHTALITPDEEQLCGKYLNALMHSSYFQRYWSNNASGSGQRYTLSQKVIEDAPLYLPDIDIQREIGEFFSDLDRKICLNKKENETLEAMAKQLYDYWFVQFDFPDTNGRPYKTSGGKMVWNETLKREIPEGWEDEQIMSSFHVVNGATPSTKEASNYGEEIIWITPKDLSEQQSKFTYKGARSITQKGYDSCSTSLIPSGSILMSSRAPIGLVSIAANELCTNQGFKSFYSDNPDYNLYLYYYILDHMKQIEQLGSGTTFKEVSRESISAFPIIAAYKKDCYATWVEQIKPIFEKQAALVSENNTLTETRDFLLPLLMNGQIKL